MIKTTEREAMKKRAEAATPGQITVSDEYRAAVRDEHGNVIGVLNYPDAELYAHAREDILALLEENDTLRNTCLALRGTLGEIATTGMKKADMVKAAMTILGAVGRRVNKP